MAAKTYNISAEQGATFERSILYTDAAGDPIDLTGFTAAMQVRDKAEASVFVLELTTGNTMIALGGAAGTIVLAVDAADMINVPAGRYVYDLELYDGANTKRLIEGSFNVKAEVTR